MRSAQATKRERGIFREEKRVNIDYSVRVAHTPTKCAQNSPSSSEMMCFP